MRNHVESLQAVLGHRERPVRFVCHSPRWTTISHLEHHWPVCERLSIITNHYPLPMTIHLAGCCYVFGLTIGIGRQPYWLLNPILACSRRILRHIIIHFEAMKQPPIHNYLNPFSSFHQQFIAINPFPTISRPSFHHQIEHHLAISSSLITHD